MPANPLKLLEATTSASRASRNATAGARGSAAAPAPRPRVRKVIGNDDRTVVPDTTVYPYRAICKVIARFPNNDIAHGTGFFAGPHLVVTAGHCVVHANTGDVAVDIRVIPGARPGAGGNIDAPNGEPEVASWEASEEYAQSRSPNHDIGAIFLAEDAGAHLGYLAMRVAADNALKASNVAVAGYPIDRGSGKAQYRAVAPVVGVAPEFVRYSVDTNQGQSGAPVFWSVEKSVAVVALHVYEDQQMEANVGLRITPAWIARVKSWLEQ